MLIQELYQTYSRWAEGHMEPGEARATWRWIKDSLEQIQPTDRAMRLEDILRRLEANEPIQYITNRAYFFEMELYVNEHVLIPRPETEELVFYVSNKVKAANGALSGRRVLDIGTGSGCVALGLSNRLPEADIWACDVDEKAIDVAKKNSQAQGKDIHNFVGDFTQPDSIAEHGPYDVIVSNPPYILEEEKSVMSVSTKYEPDVALYSRGDAVWAYENIARLANDMLVPGGLLAFELNEYHVETILGKIRDLNFRDIEVLDDLQGKPRVLMATKTSVNLTSTES